MEFVSFLVNLCGGTLGVRSILILSTYLRLGLPSGLFPFGCPTNILYAFLVSKINISIYKGTETTEEIGS
jgi:hypothetical protein